MERQIGRNILFVFAWILILTSTFYLTKLSQSQHLFEVSILYGTAFIGYVLLLFQANHFSKKFFYFGAIVLALICFIELPYLSNDYFRFLWDGEMMHLGINPYDFTPDEMIQKNIFESCYYLDLHAGMGELSRTNYSCYPTFNQGYFYISTGVFKNVWMNVLLMRSFLLITLLVSLYYFEKLLLHFNFHINRVAILLINPLVIVETFANLHFELPMVCFLIVALYFLLKNKLLVSGVLFAMSVHVKLIPLLLLPFLLPYLGWKKALKYYTIVGLTVLLLFAVLIRLDNYQNFIMSIQLYFRVFEFNSFALYPYLQYGKMQYGWNLTSLYAPKLAKTALIFILGIAWQKRKIDASELIRRILLGLMVYYFMTSTVHPWYWILPLSFSIFYFSWSLLLISFFTILSYGIYSYGNFSNYRFVLEMINTLTLILFFMEFFKPKWFQKFYPKVLS